MAPKTKTETAPTVEREINKVDIVGLGERYMPTFGMLANLRAIPDARDGLIPVRRRILFTAHKTGLLPEGGFRKCAKLVGDVMGDYHPHGDGSIYGALVRLAQSWDMRYMLLTPQGNFGSPNGKPPAAMRYTEVKLAQMGELLCRDLYDESANIVEWSPTYDGRLQEPLVLPARFPALLADGTDGVGWGDSTTVLPHNLRELLDAAVMLIDNPKVAVANLMKALPGPDFPGGAIIVANDDWEQIIETGKGKVVARAKMHTEAATFGRRQSTAIVIDELPYQVTGSALIEKIEGLVNDAEGAKSLDGIIADIRSESAQKTRIVITLDPGVEPERGLQAVLAATAIGTKGAGLQKSYTVDQRVIIDGYPKVTGTRGILLAWIEHQFDVLTRRTLFFKARAEAQLELEEAKIISHKNAEALVRLVKESGSEAEIVTSIMARYKTTERQASYIANLPLKTYGKMNMDAVHATIAKLKADIAEYKRLLASRPAMAELLKNEIREIRAKFGDDRRTSLETETGATIKSADELLPDAGCWIQVSSAGLIARLPEAAFRVTKRGTQGVTSAARPEDDPLVAVTFANVRDRLWLITSTGNLFGLRAAEVEEGTRGSKGMNPRRFLSLADTERVTHVVVAPADGTGELVLATSAGKVIRTRISDYNNLNSAGLRAIGVGGDDSVVSVSLARTGQHLIAVSSDGYAARFDIDDVPIQGRGSQGVVSMKVGAGAKVVSLLPVEAADKRDLALVLSNGRGKRSKLTDYPLKGRAIRGVLTIDLGTAGKGKPTTVAFAAPMGDEDEVMFTTNRSRAVRMAAKEIKRQGRATAGVITVALSASIKDPEAVVGGTIVAG